MTISLKNKIIKAIEIEMSVITMIDMIIEDLEKEKDKETIESIGNIETIAEIVREIENTETIETEIDKERDKGIEIDIIKTIKVEILQFRLHLTLAICPIIV
jgi:hypothetical protein